MKNTIAFIAVILLAAAAPAFAIHPVSRTAKTNLAVRGYDPVAYFTEKKPVLGSRELEIDWMGAKWRFASAANRDAFRKEPQKFAPQYGGYCAYGVASGYAVPSDPRAWAVVDGKLYLNYDKKVQAEWAKSSASLIRKADKNWPQVLAGK